MKTPIWRLVSTLLLLGGLMAAAFTPAGAAAELVITDVSPNRSPLDTAHAALFTVTYTNQGDEPLPDGATVTLTLHLQPETGEPLTCQTTITQEVPLPPGESRTLTLNECPMDFPAAGAYTLTASIDGSAAAPKTLLVQEAETALPEELNRLFTGLGLFAAVMAIMAVGTEVAIDTLRVLLGMKRKVTALEALDKLQDQLPGKLAELGVSAPELKEFQEQVAQMKAVLTPGAEVAEAVALIAQGSFGAAIRKVLQSNLIALINTRLDPLVESLNIPEEGKTALKGLLPKALAALQTLSPQEILAELQNQLQASGQLPDEVLQPFLTKLTAESDALLNEITQSVRQQLDDWKTQIRGAVLSTLQGKLSELGLDEQTLAPFQQALDAALSQVEDYLLKMDLEGVLAGLVEVFLSQGKEIGAQWLESQAETLLTRGAPAILHAFEQEVQPLLTDLGVVGSALQQARQNLQRTLQFLTTKAELASTAYVDSLKNLLLAVEERRNETQSPSRKAWRKARGASFSLWVALAAVLLTAALWSWWLPEQTALRVLITLGVGVLSVLLSSLIRGKLEGNLLEMQWREREITVLEEAANQTAYPPPTRRRAKALRSLIASANPVQVSHEYAVTLSSLYSWALRFREKNAADAPPALALRGHSWCILPYFSLGDLLSIPETALNYFLRRENNMGKLSETLVQKIERMDKTNVAAILQERQDHHRDEEASRLRWLRVISVVIGVGLAYALNIDAAILLDNAIPGISDKVNANIVILNPRWLFPRLPDVTRVITPGIVLTGLAASAGSAFWHDQLDRLQAAKKSAEAAAKLLQKAQQG